MKLTQGKLLESLARFKEGLISMLKSKEIILNINFNEGRFVLVRLIVKHLLKKVLVLNKIQYFESFAMVLEDRSKCDSIIQIWGCNPYVILLYIYMKKRFYPL